MTKSRFGTILRRYSSGDLFSVGAAGVTSVLDAAGVLEDDADGS